MEGNAGSVLGPVVQLDYAHLNLTSVYERVNGMLNDLEEKLNSYLENTLLPNVGFDPDNEKEMKSAMVKAWGHSGQIVWSSDCEEDLEDDE